MNVLDPSQIRELRLFDANCRLGPSDLTVSGAPTTAVDLVSEMDRYGMAEALVYHASADGYGPEFGNTCLKEEIMKVGRLHGCWVVFPHHTGEMRTPRMLVEGMSAAGVRAARMFPARHRFLLSDWSANELLEAFSEHRFPLFLDYDRTHWAENVVDYNSVFRICKEFPALPVILVREGIGSTRYIYALLERFDNLYIEISYYQTACGLEDISKKFSARHLLFGTGLPMYAAGPVISMLLYSGISPEERRMVGGNNLRRLLEAAR
jgi:predicted TIM-barrel fold metal-dependent hydrolase